MATTFKDFMVECELYPYSRDHYDLMKECSELELMEKYIENQIYVNESKAMLENGNFHIGENYLAESINQTELDVITEAFSDKVNNLIVKLSKMIMKIFKTFSTFFGKLGNKFDPITTKGQNVRSKLGSVTLDDEKLAKIKEIVDGAKNNQASAFPIRKNQPYAKNIKMTYGGHAEYYNDLKDALAVALSDKTVVAEALLNDSGDNIDSERIGIMDPDEIRAAGTALTIGKQRQIMNVTKSLYNSWKHVKANGLEIEVNTKSINKTAKDLNDLCDKINEMVKKVTDGAVRNYAVAKSVVDKTADAATKEVSKQDDVHDSPILGIASILNGVSNNSPTASNVSKEINNTVSMLTNTIGLTTKVYMQLSAYRQTVINQLYDFLKNIK